MDFFVCKGVAKGERGERHAVCLRSACKTVSVCIRCAHSEVDRRKKTRFNYYVFCEDGY